MADVFDKTKRSWIMSRVLGRDTHPEIVVRNAVRGLGFKYRLHVKMLPGRPDIVLTEHRRAIFVHGCFWHGHRGCKRSKKPVTRKAFWARKIAGNIARDRRARRELRREGWKVLTVWGCEVHDLEKITKKISTFLR